MVIPSKARKEAGINTGDVVLVEPNGDGRILLTRLERPRPARHANARLIRRKGRHSVIAGAPKVDPEKIKRILRDEFP
jgi:bifunctional DNA-binding transcriptional regulator/antitoxin component of YhaV-PrlF toxin-antitoxin module